MIAQSDERLVLIPRFASLMDTGRDPAGILGALSSPAVLLLYYLSVTKRQAPTSLDDPRFSGISAQESCYWTSRPYLLGGVAISFIFTCIAGISEAMALKVIPVLGGFMATMLAGAFSVLVVAFIYVERHWKEWWQQVRGTDSWDVETAFWRPYRKRFLRIVILISGAFFFLARFGYHERIERSPIVGLYQPIGLAGAAMILILLWGSRNPFLVLLRGAALLLMTGILTAGTVGLFYALFENQVTPAVVLPLAAMVCVSFIFHHRWERSNPGWLELTRTNPESRPAIPFYTAIERSSSGGDHKDVSNLEDPPEVVRLRE